MSTRPEHAHRPHLDGVEAMRGFAALAIVAFHVIHLTPATLPASLESLRWALSYGVPLFFVISAFSLAYGYAGRLGSGPERREFYLRRLFRIAPLYYLALAAQIGVTAYLGGALPDAGSLALALSFLFNLSPQMVDGIAPASWSVGVEMLFYAVFPLVLALAGTLPRAILTTLAATAVALAYAIVVNKMKLNPSFLVHGLIFNLPYFGFGLIAHRIAAATPVRWGGPLVLAAIAGIVVTWALAPMLTVPAASGVVNVLYMLGWGAPFGLLCVGMALKPPRLLSNRLTQFLGRISFGLYLGHPQVIFLLDRLQVYAAIYRLPGGSGVTFPLAVLVTATVTAALAWGLYRLVEAPGIALGKQLASRFAGPKTDAAAA